MRTNLVRLLTALIAAAVLLSQIPPPIQAPPAAAQGQALRAAPGIFRIFGAWRGRNRVYREANVTQRGMNGYYERLTETAQQQLLDRELRTPDGNQLRAYMRMRAGLIEEQRSVTAQIEAEKNDARRRFNRTLTNQLVQILVASPGGQSLLGDLRRNVDELRQAATAVQSAIAENRPFDLLAQQLADQVGEIPVLRETAYKLGHQAGRKLDNLLGGVLSRMDNAMANMDSGMGEALAEIERIDGELARFDETERTPVSLVEDGSPLGQIRAVDRANAAVDVAAQAYTNAAIAAGALSNPSEGQRQSMKDRVRDRLLSERLDRISDLRSRTRNVTCEAVGQGAYIAAANELGLPLQLPLDPASAVYLVCRRMPGDELVTAMLTSEEEETTAETEQPEAGTDEPRVLATEPPEQGLPEDRCSLSGRGDFVLEQITISGQSSTCDDLVYPFGSPTEPLLLALAGYGVWEPDSAAGEQASWTWQQTAPLEDTVVSGTAVIEGSELVIEVTMDIDSPPAAELFGPGLANGWAMFAVLPLFPLALRFNWRRRRWLLVTTSLALLLVLQSCGGIYGDIRATYTFPLPEQGFACEVEPENPNLAEMPAASGQASLQLTLTDEEDEIESTCQMNANFSGLGVLKRDGVYTEADLNLEE